MRRYRRWIALAIVAVLAGACTALPGASAAAPSGPPSPSLPAASSVPTTAPVASPEVSASPVPPIDGDVAPPDVMGATFLADLMDGVTVVGRVGEKERLVVPAGSFAFFDRAGTVIISTPGAKDTELTRVDTATGEVAWRTTVPDGRYVGSISGENLVLGGWNGDEATDVGLVLVDVATGASRILTPAGPAPRDAISWSRTGLITPSGTQVLTSLCALNQGCENSLVDVADGSTVRALPGTTPPIIATDRFAVTYDGYTVTGIDLRNGNAGWTRADEDVEFGGGYAISDQRIVTAWFDRTGSIFRVELVDLASGRGDVVTERDFSEDWTLWPELSHETSAVIGHGGPIRIAAAEGKPVQAAVVDLGTGAFDDRAVRLVPVQP